MIRITDIEKKYLELLESDITIQQFESWVYENEEIFVKETSQSIYQELLELNYKSKGIRYELSKLIKIDSERLIKYKIQRKISKILEGTVPRIEDLKYQMLFDLETFSFSFRIGGINFLMHNPFDDNEFKGITDDNRVDLFESKFKDERLFLDTINQMIETDFARVWDPMTSTDMDERQKSTVMRNKDKKLKIIIDNKTFLFDENYLKERMKIAWP